MNKPMTTAERLTADIAQLRRDFTAKHDALVTSVGAILDGLAALSRRIEVLEDAVTTPQPEPAPAKPAKPVPPPGYVTVKTMCSETDLSYDTEASNMLRHYARHFCTAMRIEVWRRPDTGKGYDHFPREAADYAIDRVKKERAGELPPSHTEAHPHVNGANGQ